MTRETDHVAELAIGGKARRSANLRALPPEPASIPVGWELRDGVPALHADGSCSNTVRPCPYVKCERHLWMVDARDRPGRRYASGAGPRSELAPATMTTCERDVIEYARRTVNRGRVLLTYAEIGEVLGISDERARQCAQRAAVKLHEQGVELGLEVERASPKRAPANDVTEQDLDDLIAAFEAA